MRGPRLSRNRDSELAFEFAGAEMSHTHRPFPGFRRDPPQGDQTREQGRSQHATQMMSSFCPVDAGPRSLRARCPRGIAIG